MREDQLSIIQVVLSRLIIQYRQLHEARSDNFTHQLSVIARVIGPPARY